MYKYKHGYQHEYTVVHSTVRIAAERVNILVQNSTVRALYPTCTCHQAVISYRAAQAIGLFSSLCIVLPAEREKAKVHIFQATV